MQETMETTQAMIDHLAAVNKILEKNNYSEGRLFRFFRRFRLFINICRRI